MTFAAIVVHPDGSHHATTIEDRDALEQVVGGSYDYLQVTDTVELIHADEPGGDLNLFASFILEELSGDSEPVYGDAVFVGAGEGDFQNLSRTDNEAITELLDEAIENLGGAAFDIAS